MKNVKNLFEHHFFVLLLVILFAFPNIKCDFSFDSFNDYFKTKTLDRIRQIYWNIVLYSEKESVTISKYVTRSYAEEFLHTNTRAIFYKKLNDVYNYCSNIFYEIEDFSNAMNFIDIFKKENIDYLFSNEMPRHFLINFAINIDKYERIKKNILYGISDYINYLTNDIIIEYLKEKLNEYKDDIENNFDKIVLNNININYENYIDYFKNKTREELIDAVHGFENYYFNVLNNSNDAYYFYKYGELINIENDDIYKMISLYNKELNFNNIDDFMYQIEYRNFTYIVNKKFIDLNKAELNEKLVILEKYCKRQMNLKKSLRGLNSYINDINMDNQKIILSWGLSKYPELYSEGIFEDISSSERNLKYGEVKEFIQVTERNILLKYVYNIHTYQNNIKSIYDKNLFDLYRYPTDKLYDVILSDTNKNKDLQEKTTFIDYADLNKENLYEFIAHLERTRLKKIVSSLIRLYFNSKSFFQSYEISSRIHTKDNVKEYYSNEELLAVSKNYIEEIPITNTTSEFLEIYKDDIKEFNSIKYYNNIHDYLRSTNIYYLKQWLSKLENYNRKEHMMDNVQGGMKYNYMDDYKKEDLLELFDVYINRFPDYLNRDNFIKIFGLDNDITPHKMIAELFDLLIEYNTAETILKICDSLTGYFQRKNIQANFNFENFRKELNNTLYDHLIIANSFSYTFQFFRIINIFPELNNKKIFELICLNNETRIINLDEKDYLESYFKRDKKKIAKNIQYYLNYSDKYDNVNLDLASDEELQIYIRNFLQSTKYRDKKDLKSQILDGYFPYIIYDYFESYLNSIDDVHLNFIFNNVKAMCSQNYPCNKTSQAVSVEEKRNEIIQDIKNVQEFQNPEFFDKHFDYFENIQKGSFAEFLINSSNKDLKLYTILTYIIQLEDCENKDEKKCKDLKSDYLYKIFMMSRNEMIRYVLKEHEINKEKINENMLPLLIKYYMLDLGSDNIYDLTLY